MKGTANAGEAWQKPENSDSGSALGAQSSESSSDDMVHPTSPSTHVAPLPSLSQDHLVSRSPSKNSKNSSDVIKVVEGLTSFRAALLTNQRLTLQMLDMEMEKVKQLPGMLPPDAKLEKRGKSKEVRVRLPGALGPDADGDFGNPRFLSKETKQSLSPAPFAHLQTLDQKRKRRMSWIPKTGSLPGAGTHSTDLVEMSEMPNLPNVPQSESPPELPVKLSTNSRRTSKDADAESVESLVVAHLTKAEKAQAKREAEAFQEAGMLAQFNADLARSQVRKRAAEEFEISKQNDQIKTEGCLPKIAKSSLLERATMTVIFLNAVWLSIDLEFNQEADIIVEAPPLFFVVENLFCTYFTAELLIRYLVYTRTWYAMKDPWFVFDLLLVSLMIFETWIMALVYVFSGGGGGGIVGGTSVLRVARVLRVLRTARMARLVRFMPELMILIKGMMVACRSVFFTLILLLLITYVFAVAFMQFSRDTPDLRELFFSSMPTTVENLILHCIFPDQAYFYSEVAADSAIMAFLVVMFIFLGTLTVMNMLLGVLVEAIKTVSEIEREQMDVDFAKKALWELISKGAADEDGDNRISEQEFVNVLSKPEAVTALTSLGVDVDAALDYGKLLFEDGEPLTFPDFMRGILTLRGSNQTTVKDIVDLRKFTAEEFSQLHDVLRELCVFLMGQGQPKDNVDTKPSRSSSHTSGGAFLKEPS